MSLCDRVTVTASDVRPYTSYGRTCLSSRSGQAECRPTARRSFDRHAIWSTVPGPLMPEKPFTPPLPDTATPDATNKSDLPVETSPGPTANSTLQGHLDYADLAERLGQGVTVRREIRSDQPKPTSPDRKQASSPSFSRNTAGESPASSPCRPTPWNGNARRSGHEMSGTKSSAMVAT